MFYALIVGNDVYEANEFANLRGAVRDAEKLAKFFEEKLPTVGGYDEGDVCVTLLRNPTSEQVRKEFDAIVCLLDRNSVFVFYFAGHGLCLAWTDRPSLLCRDAMGSLLDGAVSAGEIAPQFITAASRRGFGDMLFIFDACRSAVFKGRGDSPRQKGMRGLCRDAASRKNRDRGSGNRCALSSCRDGERASDDGAFLDAILAEWNASLDSGDGLAVGWEFVARVSQRLLEQRCRQRPEFEGVSFALTPGGKKDRFSLGRALRSVLASAATGIVIGLVVLATILLFPKVASLLYKSGPTPPPRPPVVETSQETPGGGPGSATTNETPGGGPTSDQTTGASTDSPTAGCPVETDAFLWADSLTRKAGTRQILKVGDKEYVFVWIPFGEFDMGSPTTEVDHERDETLHHVKLTKGFWMLETETTQALYKEVMGENPSWFKGDNLPVERVSWNDAMKFCAELTKRLPAGLKATLPTEAQWEYACRAGTKTPFSFGSVLNGDKANCDGYFSYGTSTKGKCVGKTTPVKSYDPNPWNLYDMHGNVYEWCLDYYGDYPTGSVTDPKGPNSASVRVSRGGSWHDFAWYCRSAIRSGLGADCRNFRFGFRVLVSCD